MRRSSPLPPRSPAAFRSAGRPRVGNPLRYRILAGIGLWMEVRMKALRLVVFGILAVLLVACGSSPSTAASSPSPKGFVVVVTNPPPPSGTFLLSPTTQRPPDLFAN